MASHHSRMNQAPADPVSLHHGGGVRMGFSRHSGMVICCDGTPEATPGSAACSA